MAQKKVKVITAKIGLDDHYRGILSVTYALRDAGMEVVYLGAGQRVQQVIASASQEDADVIGLSFLCGGHVEVMRRFMSCLQEQGLGHMLVVVGGVIPDEDVPKLLEMRVARVFLPGTTLKEIVSFVQQGVAERSHLSSR